MSKQIGNHSETPFRVWMNLLKNVRGNQPLWPILLGSCLDAEFRRQQNIEEWYSADVFKDRDSHEIKDSEKEEHLVGRLFRNAHSDTGCLYLRHHPIWLLGYQWPNQGGHRQKGRRADLVGMSQEGGLVVFEAKVADGDPPLVAIVEGLDYLACLLRPGNLSKIQSGFAKWKQKPGRIVPVGFNDVVPTRHVRPMLVVLAPAAYFSGKYSRSRRGSDWPSLADIGTTFMDSVSLEFAATDFSSTKLMKPRFSAK